MEGVRVPVALSWGLSVACAPLWSNGTWARDPCTTSSTLPPPPVACSESGELGEEGRKKRGGGRREEGGRGGGGRGREGGGGPRPRFFRGLGLQDHISDQHQCADVRRGGALFAALLLMLASLLSSGSRAFAAAESNETSSAPHRREDSSAAAIAPRRATSSSATCFCRPAIRSMSGRFAKQHSACAGSGFSKASRSIWRRAAERGRARVVVEVSEATPFTYQVALGLNSLAHSTGVAAFGRLTHYNLFGEGKILDFSANALIASRRPAVARRARESSSTSILISAAPSDISPSAGLWYHERTTRVGQR